MDIEERLEQAEKSETPSLVGSSIRSADDSSHNNYIHPEKYNSRKENSTNNKLNNYSSLSSAITASLDDLINEGALLGSEEDFDKFLEQDGSVKIDAIMEEDATHAEKHPKKDQEKESNEEEEPKVENASKTVDDEPIEAETEASEVSLGKSTPQKLHQIQLQFHHLVPLDLHHFTSKKTTRLQICQNINWNTISRIMAIYWITFNLMIYKNCQLLHLVEIQDSERILSCQFRNLNRLCFLLLNSND